MDAAPAPSGARGIQGDLAGSCAHCGLPVSASAVRGAGGEPFCCRGCKAAYEAITGCGLGAYYRLRAGEGASGPGPVGEVQPTYRALDDPQARARYVAPAPSGGERAVFTLEGLHCASCVWLLERLPDLVPGVVSARVRWGASTLEVVWDRPASLGRVAQAVATLGYRPHPVPVGARPGRRRQDREEFIRLGVAGAAAGNAMLLAVALYLGAHHGMRGWVMEALRMASAAVGLVAVLGPGRVFFVGARAALRTRTPHMDLPVALGLGVGAAAGLVNVLRGAGEIYFDTLSVLVFLLLVGRWLQGRQQARAAEAVRVLGRLTPDVAHRRAEDGAVEDVPVEALRVGDRVRVAPGEVFPADGRVVSPEDRQGATTSSVDCSVLTGESRPVPVTVGEEVHAGTVNLGAPLEVEVRAVGDDTRVGALASLVEEAAERRPAVVQWADRVGAVFVVAVISLAGATFAGWMLVDPAQAVEHSVALLIVACPCALGLATPLALSVGIASAARRGILIKGGDVLQRLSRPGTVWLDKTGTVTDVQPRVLAWHGDRSAIPVVAALERHVVHPVARALVDFGAAQGASDAGPGVASDEEVHAEDDGSHDGVSGRIGGDRLRVGSLGFMARHGLEPEGPLACAVQRALSAGHTPICVARGRQVVAVAELGAGLRPEAAEMVRALERSGWTVGLLSGDHPDVVRQVGARLGLPRDRCLGHMSPEDKARIVAETPGTTMMVGDGVNDGAALAAAAVGVAVHGGAEVSLRAAPVFLSRPGLSGIWELLQVSRRTMGVVRRNLALSLAYNAAAVGLAAVGLIGPLGAAVLMPLSSLTVVGSSILGLSGRRL